MSIVTYSGWLDGVSCSMEVNDPRPLFVTDGLLIDAAHFPDAGFRSAVAQLADTNGNGWLTDNELAIEHLLLRSGDIRSLEGIGHFPELTQLSVPASQLEEVDLSGNLHLQRLNLRQNALTSLIVSTLTGTICADSGLSVPRPVWIWNGPEEAVFRLPSGREVQAETTAETGPRDTMLICSATATVDGVPFTQGKVLHQICFIGTNLPERWLAVVDVLLRPENPVRIGSAFLGWYTTATGTVPFDFTAPVSGAKTVYAHWLTPVRSMPCVCRPCCKRLRRTPLKV